MSNQDPRIEENAALNACSGARATPSAAAEIRSGGRTSSSPAQTRQDAQRSEGMSDRDVHRHGASSSSSVDCPVSPADERIESRPARAADPRPLLSDEDEHMVECFVTGLLTCPEKYHDCFIDSWIDSHPSGRTLLFTAYMVVDLVERFHKVGYGRPDQETA